MAFEPVLLRNVGVEGSTTLKVYEQRGGYQGLRRALTMTPEDVTATTASLDTAERAVPPCPTGRCAVTRYAYVPGGSEPPA